VPFDIRKAAALPVIANRIRVHGVAISIKRRCFVNSDLQHPVEISLVAPMYNEENALELFFSEVDRSLSAAGISYEIICINDGSLDNTLTLLSERARQDRRIKVINLSRNFGKEQALTAGLDYATGQAAIPIDCDLQDPPDVIPVMYHKWKEGYDVVLAKRSCRAADSFFKRTSSALFYRLIAAMSDIHLPANVGDFRLLDRKALDALKRHPERSRFMKGLLASLGFRSATVEYERPARSAGQTKWNFVKLYRLALEGLFSFTSIPLKIWSYLGVLVAMSGFAYGGFLVFHTIAYGRDVPGYASLMVVLLFMSGLILISLGIIGEYLARIFIEVKGRPIYIVSDTIGFDEQDQAQLQPPRRMYTDAQWPTPFYPGSTR
jgi:glycosyltransferase involved in cell wall biosynthesis